MRSFWNSIITGFLLCALVVSASAQEKTVGYRLQLLTASEAPDKHIADSKYWKTFLRQATVLEHIEGLTEVGKPTLVFPAYKKPLAYFDPRPGRTQVQYVDVGLKLDLTLIESSNGYFQLESRTQYSKHYPHPQLEARSKLCVYESLSFCKRGQTAVFLAIRGPLAAKHLKELFPSANITQESYFIMALTLQ